MSIRWFLLRGIPFSLVLTACAGSSVGETLEPDDVTESRVTLNAEGDDVDPAVVQATLADVFTNGTLEVTKALDFTQLNDGTWRSVGVTIALDRPLVLPRDQGITNAVACSLYLVNLEAMPEVGAGWFFSDTFHVDGVTDANVVVSWEYAKYGAPLVYPIKNTYIEFELRLSGGPVTQPDGMRFRCTTDFLAGQPPSMTFRSDSPAP